MGGAINDHRLKGESSVLPLCRVVRPLEGDSYCICVAAAKRHKKARQSAGLKADPSRGNNK